jgi:hypothetical protein
MFRVVITMIVLRKLARSRGNLDAMRCSQRTLYEVRPRKDKRGADPISEALPFDRLWYAEPEQSATQLTTRSFGVAHTML